MDPKIRPGFSSLEIFFLKGTIQLGVIRIPHQQSSEFSRELRAETPPAVFHETADEGGWNRREFMICEAPIPAEISVSN